MRNYLLRYLQIGIKINMRDHYPVEHTDIKGDLDDSAHTIDTRYAMRISDELVSYTDPTENGRQRFGEVVGIVTPDKTHTEGTEHDGISNANSLYVVRYPDHRSPQRHKVGLATRVDGELKQGIMLEPDAPVYFGRAGDMQGGTAFMGEKTVLGLAALSGVEDKGFGNGVSRIHGSFMLMPDGRLMVSDGYEAVSPDTRAVIDKGSLNATRVTTAQETGGFQSNILAERERQHAQAEYEARLTKLFASPQESPEARPRAEAMTPQSITEAVATLIASKDTGLKQVIGQHMKTVEGATYADARQQVFNDSALRVEVGKYLLQKAKDNREVYLEEFRNGEEKPPNYPGYTKMRSEEYIVLLAMSMIDGTFITGNSQKDPVQLYHGANATKFENGRHRVAALRLLGVENGDGVPEHIKWAHVYKS